MRVDSLKMSTDGAVATKAAPVYKAYASRWWLLTLLCITSALSSFIWLSAASVFTIMTEIFEASAIEINMLSMSYYIM